MEAISSLIYTATTWAIPIVIAITFHEAAHGWVANRLGDDTAARLGRVTFNPFKHVDPFGTIVLPALLLLMRAPFLFGYAKPVPVNFARLKHPRRDMIWVALAGPGVNIALAFVCALGLHVALSLPGVVGEWLLLNLRNGLLINVVLAVFNLLPVPPLDGSRVVTGLLPPGPAGGICAAGPLRPVDPFGPAVHCTDGCRPDRFELQPDGAHRHAPGPLDPAAHHDACRILTLMLNSRSQGVDCSGEYDG